MTVTNKAPRERVTGPLSVPKAHIQAQSRLVSCEDGLAIAEIGPVCLIEWNAPVIGRRFERQRLALESIAARFPGEAGVVCVMSASSPVPEDRYRRSLIDVYSRLASQIRAVVCVLEGAGFIAAAARSGLSGMIQLLAKRPGDILIRATVESSLPWLAQKYNEQLAELVRRTHNELAVAVAATK